MADMITLVNTILQNASTEYQSRVPEATRDNITAVAAPILTYQSTQNEFLSSLVNRIGLVIVRNKIIQNPLKVLKQGEMPLGKDIQEIFTNPAKADKFNGTGTDAAGKTLLSQVKPDTYTLYHRRNREDQYTVTISQPQLASAFTSWEKLEELLNSVVNSLYSGDNYDEFILSKNLLAEAVSEGKVVTVEVDDIATSPKGFVKALKNASNLFTFPSSNFNKFKALNAALIPAVQVNDIITWTPLEDQILILRSDIATEIDVEVLAVSFNLSKADFLARTLLVDSFGSATTCYGILADKSWTQVYDNLTQMTEFYNGKAMAWNYYWNHWQTYSISHFANAVAFVHTPEPPAAG
jgi:hypothetical protein